MRELRKSYSYEWAVVNEAFEGNMEILFEQENTQKDSELLGWNDIWKKFESASWSPKMDCGLESKTKI